MIRTRDESGQAMVLILGLLLIALAVTGLAVDGTRAFIYRRTLQNAADAAALAGADAIDLDAYYGSGGTRIVLDGDAAERAARVVLARRRIAARVAIAGSADAIVVSLRSPVTTSFLRLIGIASLPVSASARAAPIPGS